MTRRAAVVRSRDCRDPERLSGEAEALHVAVARRPGGRGMTLGDPQVGGVPSQTGEGPKTAPVERRGALMEVEPVTELSEMPRQLRIK
jgi:hypothetical protein